MSSKAGFVSYQLTFQQRPVNSRGDIFKINSGYEIEVRGVNGSGPRSVKVKSVFAGKAQQTETFSMNRSLVYEVLIAKDVQKIPVTLFCGGKSKTFEWQAPFAKFPIEIAVSSIGTAAVVLPEEQKEENDIRELAPPPKDHKEVGDSKEGTKEDEAAAANPTDSLKSSAKAENNS